MTDITVPYEYCVDQKNEGKWKWRRIGLLFLYILYPALLIFIVGSGVGALAAPLLCFIPLSTWMLVFFTWRYVNVSYEYTVISGKLTFTKHFGTSSHKKQFDTMLKNAIIIAPVGNREYNERLELFRPVIRYNGIASEKSPDGYFIAFVDETGKHSVFFFEATKTMLDLCKMYFPDTVSSKVRF